MLRVDAYNQVMATYKPQGVNAPKRTNNAAPAARDQVQISSYGQDLAIARNAVKESSDVREDKVAQMKEKYGTDGQMPDVDMDDFASVLISKFQGVF